MSRAPEYSRYGDSDLSSQRLQPYLLDRLTRDPDEPSKDTSLSEEDFRDCICRDLTTLLNAKCHPDHQVLARRYPLLASSAMNFGIPPLSGLNAAALDPAQIVAMVRKAIENFEPRIKRQNLKIRLAPGHSADQSQGACLIRLEIECEAVAIPIRLVLRTELNVATGICEVQEQSNG